MWRAILFATISMVFLCVVLVLIVHTPRESAQQQQTTPITLASPSPTPIPTPVPPEGFTILLMGKGGAGHDGGGLTDTMDLVRIVDSEKKVLLLSIPRDLWVHVDGSHDGKINSASALGGGALAKQVVETVTGLHVDKYITIDFSGFEQAIDSIGGIEITVERSFTDYEYPIEGREAWDCTTAPSDPAIVSEADLISQGKLDKAVLTGLPAQYPCRYERLHFDAGTQQMDGKTALKYVRSRHSAEEGNDFARSSRQRLLMQAVATKLFSLGEIAKLPSFFSTLRSHLDTDFSIADIVGLLPRAATIHSYPVIQPALTIDNELTESYTSDRQFALFPITGQDNYTAIRNWIASSLSDQIPLLYPQIEVASTKPTASASASMLQTLISAGYPAHKVILTAKEATKSATLLIQNKALDSNVIQKVQDLAGVSSSFVSTPRSGTWLSGSDLKLILPW